MSEAPSNHGWEIDNDPAYACPRLSWVMIRPIKHGLEKRVKLKRHLSIFMVTVLINFIAASSVSAIDRLVFSTFKTSGETLVPERVMREVYKRLGYEIEVRQLPGGKGYPFGRQGHV